MRIYLTGFMGSGKTITGRILARDLGFGFADLDAEIEQTAGRPVSAIFEEPGEPYFRKLETDLLKGIATTNIVVSTGGGCFIHNHDWMLANGTVVYLEIEFESLARRIGADPTRPLWRNAEALFRERESVYRRAHIIVDAAGTPEEVSIRIRNRFL